MCRSLILSCVVTTFPFLHHLKDYFVVYTIMAKRFLLSGSTSHIPLMDNERDIQDTISSVNHLSFYQQVTLNAESSPVFYAMKKLGVLSACIPKAHLFPKFIRWLVSSMYPGKCFVMNSHGENVLQVSSQLICQALCFP